MIKESVGPQSVEHAQRVAARKKPYAAPKLTVFGEVAALTQSATGCSQSDSSGCSALAGSNMGPMA